MAPKVAGLAIKDGYKNVKTFMAGAPGWLEAEKMFYASNEFVAKGNIVLLDLRSAKKSAAGRIARSVTIPYDTLEDRLDDLPRKAAIVLYSDSAEEAASAVEDLRDEGFKKVSLVDGNFSGWVKSGGKVVTGPVVTDINWVRKLGKGEVVKADFMKAVSGADAYSVILDVRTADEVSAGAFKNAITIPLDQIGSRLSEIPKNKKIYIYCSTGARADMAAQELNKNGFKAFFLVANVECEGNDCEIEN